MGGVLAEHLAKLGRQISYVTTGGQASSWTLMTNELPLIHRALAKANVPIHTLQRVIGFDGEKLELAEIFSGVTRNMECRSLVIVGVRKPRDTLYQELDAHAEDLKDAGIASITRIGDAHAPGAIVHAVHSGHKYARELGATLVGLPYQRDFQV
jgi:dimethylamine/trimethylamine dehydrogenase